MNNILTNTYKNIIKKNQLVDSGKLLNDLQVDSFFEGINLIINIKAPIYLTYLNNDYKLNDQFIVTNEFQNEVNNMIFAKAEPIINDIIDGKNVTVPDYKILIRINNQ